MLVWIQVVEVPMRMEMLVDTGVRANLMIQTQGLLSKYVDVDVEAEEYYDVEEYVVMANIDITMQMAWRDTEVVEESSCREC